MNLNKEMALTYDDVLLVPQNGVVKSRNMVELETNLSTNVLMEIPIVAAPMSSVVDAHVASVMADLGGGAFIHRNQSVEGQIAMWKEVLDPSVGCAIGTTETLEARFRPLYDAGCRLFCLDVAHAHSLHTAAWLDSIPETIWENIDFIIGSIATPEAVEFFQDRFPVAGFRVGIGPGAACTTREKTGHGVPQLTAVAECADASDVVIIADGGINTSGDIVKALAAGASSVMLGRLLAGAEDAPHPGSYYGMASERAKKETGCNNGFTEGVEATIPVDGTIESIVRSLVSGIKSGVSYAGGFDIASLQAFHQFRLVSASTERESKTRL